ncbi:regulatory protein RecX, partial [Singulisphaera rosea]
MVLAGLMALGRAEAASATSGMLDLTDAVVVSTAKSGPEKKAVSVLVEEVQKRTLVRWAVSESWPEGQRPVIAVGPVSTLPKLAGRFAEKFNADDVHPRHEGFRIRTESDGPAVFVIGNDERGVLFGVGRLLRELRMTRGKVLSPAGWDVTSSPKYPVRGHQLGYRPKTNSYDAWDLPQWDQYIRELALFGTNAIELIPPNSDDEGESPHFPRPPMEMMIGMTRILDDYGLDVWIWNPAMERDYSDPKAVEKSLKEYEDVFRKLNRIDAIFVPGGDPGHTQPKHLMALLEKETELLRKHHPKAEMWVSTQGFDKTWMDEFYAILAKEPAWLTGIVYGPHIRDGFKETRAAVPKSYPIRHYPDITHTRESQFPVPDWDLAFASTEGREPINPRPQQHATIFRATQVDTIGFLTYSEGCNDDVNKFVWSSLGWDEDADVVDILRQYSRVLIGERYADNFAQGLLALERNWEGPLLTNGSIEPTLQQFRDMERAASPADLLNWRFQQALYRAYYDAFLQARLSHETEVERSAREVLRRARELGTFKALDRAQAELERATTQPVATD